MFKYICPFEGFKDIKSLKDDNYSIVIDSNICVYLDSYFDQPLLTMNQFLSSEKGKEVAYSLIEFLTEIKTNENLTVDFSAAIEETCRDPVTRSLDSKKMFSRIDKILILLEELSLSEVINPKGSFEKHLTKNSEAAVNYIVNDEEFKSRQEKEDSLAFNTSYLYCLKIFELEKSNISREEKLKTFYDYMRNNVEIFYQTHLIYSILLWGNFKTNDGKSFKRIYHGVNKKGKKSMLNAAMDLFLVNIYQQDLIKKGNKVIFATNDQILSEIVYRYKLIKVVSFKDSVGSNETVFSSFRIKDSDQFSNSFEDALKSIEDDTQRRKQELILKQIDFFSSQKDREEIRRKVITEIEKLECLLGFS